MSYSTNASGQLITMLITFGLLTIPMAILNASIAKRKGKSSSEFGWLSIIPFVGYLLTIYLVSLTDKALLDKIDKILNILPLNDQQPSKTF